MLFSPLLTELIEALQCLPGVGNKTAQRMAFHLLDKDRQRGKKLADTLLKSLDSIGRCEQCRNFSEAQVCQICSSPKRDATQLCVVESPVNVVAIEQATDYRGHYFVLMGHLSPLDGIGPSEIGLDVLERRFAAGVVKEVILATNPTVEGEATAHFIADLAKSRGASVSRIAQGVPLGGDLDYVDGGTLAHAFVGRRQFD